MVFGCFESIAGRLLFWACLLGCVAFCVHVLGPVSSPLWVSDLSLRHAAGEKICKTPFLAHISIKIKWIR